MISDYQIDTCWWNWFNTRRCFDQIIWRETIHKIFMVGVVRRHIETTSRPEVFWRKVVLKICSKFTGEHPCRSVISVKLQSITLRHECFIVNLLYIFRTPFLKNTSEWLLLILKSLATSSSRKLSYYLQYKFKAI